jgi:hypothetical protein
MMVPAYGLIELVDVTSARHERPAGQQVADDPLLAAMDWGNAA